MATARERRDIFYNIIARVGMDGDVLGEFSKAMSTLNGMQTYNELNPPQPPNMPPEQSGMPPTPSTQPDMGLNAPQGDNSLNIT